MGYLLAERLWRDEGKIGHEPGVGGAHRLVHEILRMQGESEAEEVGNKWGS